MIFLTWLRPFLGASSAVTRTILLRAEAASYADQAPTRESLRSEFADVQTVDDQGKQRSEKQNQLFATKSKSKIRG